jgi:hypothetical protein
MERPSELTYALDERPPLLALVGLGFQHVAVMCRYFVMVALVAEAAKLPREAALSAIGLAMIAIAFTTVLRSLRLGPRLRLSLSPARLGDLSALEHRCRIVLRHWRGLRDDHLRRLLRDGGRVAHQLDA